MMTFLTILFWLLAFIVFYTFFGYGILLFILVKIKETFSPKKDFPVAEEYPDVTLLIAAYNEQDYVEEKMRNCRALDYPSDKLHITWVTDGSSDSTPDRLREYPESIKVIVRKFDDPKVGCVSGEKRVRQEGGSASASEGVYWKYESFLKNLDSRLYSAMGAAGELIAIRRQLWTEIPAGTLVDEEPFQKAFVISGSLEDGTRQLLCIS